MNFRARIWMLPLCAALVFIAGMAVSYLVGARTSNTLEQLRAVDYPYLAQVVRVDRGAEQVRLTLQAAAAEGDDAKLKELEPVVAAVHAAVDAMKAIPGKAEAAGALGAAFDAYHAAAIATTRAMLTGDMSQAGALVKRMQATQAALKELHEAQQAQAEASVSQAQHAAARGVNASVWVGLATGVAVLLALGVASWLIVASVWRDLGGEPAHLREIVQRVSDGDLDVSLRAEPGDSRSLNAALAGMVGKLRETVRSIRQATDSIADASNGIATGNQELSTRTESTASNLQQTASSMEQLTATVRHSADAAQQANGLATTATQAARRGGDIVGGVVSSMAEIDDASRRIGEIIGVIDSIAFQTNILALNAAVEAARAGEQGRGFAVVAGEVRSLAQRSAQAAREIKTLIGASSEKVESGSKLVQDAGAAMTEILGGVERVTDIIGRISSATAEQSTGIGQVNSAVSELDRMTQQNAALVQQSAASAQSLREQTLRLTQAVGAFRLEAAR